MSVDGEGIYYRSDGSRISLEEWLKALREKGFLLRGRIDIKDEIDLAAPVIDAEITEE